MQQNYSTIDTANMPSAAAYLTLLTPPPAYLRETPDSSSFPYSERHLQCVWFDPKLRPTQLTTRSGENLTIIDPGRWNQEAGPDFLDAVLLLGPERRRIQGDVEIHITPNDWNNHKHAQDKHFNKVVAHVTYTNASKPITTLPSGTIEISLKKTLSSNPAFTFESIDVTAYPYSTLPDNPRPCALKLKNWDPDKIGEMLEAAGAHRLQTKATRIAAKLKHTSDDDLLYRELLGALGYKQNTAICHKLADLIPYEIISEKSPLEGYALLLGVSGLLPTKPSPRWDTHTKTFIRKVWDAWWPQREKWQNSILPKSSWNLSSLRPQNHPTRRLAAAATFACNPITPSQQISKTFKTTFPHSAFSVQHSLPPLDYWHHHISLASPKREKPIAIIGKARISALNINILLPYLAATGHNITPLTKNLPPEQSNTIIRQTAHALFGRDHNPNLYSKNALRQQGLIQIFHDFCLTDRSACESCPLPAAL